MYNGNATQLGLFQTSTGVSFPLLQRAVNGTLYGAFRDDMMLVDQTGTQRLLVDVRNDRSWQTKITAEIDRLLTLPVGRVVQETVTVDDLRAGETTVRTLQIVNEGKADLSLSDYSSTVDGVTLELPDRALAPRDTAHITLRYAPTAAGLHTGLISITTPGALSQALSIELNADVLAPLRPRLFTATSQIDLGSIETIRPGTFAVSIRNDGNADLEVRVDESSESVSGTGSVVIPPGTTGQISFTVTPTTDGPFTGSLVLATNDADAARVTLPVTGTGITIPPAPLADFDANGFVDFPDFLFFAAAFGKPESAADLDGSGGNVDFADFLIFAQSFGKSTTN